MSKKIFCPNKSLKDWKDLVDSVGSLNAHSLWDHYNGVVPRKYYQMEVFEESKEVLPLSTNVPIYQHYNLLNKDGKIKSFPSKTKAMQEWAKFNNENALFDFVTRQVPDGSWKIFIVKPEGYIETTQELEEARAIQQEDAQRADVEYSDRYLFDNTILYQNNTNKSSEEYVASEKTIRDLAERIADRIGLKVRYESDRTKDYKGKLEGNTAVINLAYATLDTPIHEILGHPIIRAIKNKNYIKDDIKVISSIKHDVKAPKPYYVEIEELRDEDLYGDYEFFDTLEEAEKWINSRKKPSNLYQNLLKELEYGKGKEVFDRVKRDYQYKDKQASVGEQEALNKEYGFDDFNVGQVEHNTKKKFFGKTYIYKIDNNKGAWYEQVPYTLEEQQEEAIVELLGLYTADKLDKVKDGKLISLLKRLLKETKAFMRNLFNQKEVEIDKLPDNMTLGDLADLLAYSNSKLILPGNEIIYTTPDNQTFKTYQEASNHISKLIKLGEVDLSKVGNFEKLPKNFKYKGKIVKEVHYSPETEAEFLPGENQYEPPHPAIGKIVYNDGTSNTLYEEENIPNFVKKYSRDVTKLNEFINKNKEYEQSKEIIEEWKKVNGIKYDPEEVYSRGQGFYSVVGAYSDFDVELMFQNLLAHIQDNKKAGGEFTISAFTKPINKKIGHLEGGGGKIRFKIFPKSEDIKWAANTDVYSGSVWDASEKVSKDIRSELIGVSYTKSPSVSSINSVQPNLAAIIDNLAHQHNELGIELTGNNFRLEYDDNVPYSTKKLINNINNILDQKFGKLVEPKIKSEYTEEQKAEIQRLKNKISLWKIHEINGVGDKGSLDLYKRQLRDYIKSLSKQPTQTRENLEESIEEVKGNLGIIKTEHNVLGAKSKVKEITDIRKDNEGNIIEFRAVESGKDFLDSRYSFQNNKYYAEPWNYSIFGQPEPEFEITKGEFYAMLNLFNTPQKEYISQAEINTKVAALKKGMRKFPRSLIRSEVKPAGKVVQDLFEVDDLPFQKLPRQEKEKTLQDLDNKLKNILSDLGINVKTYADLKEKLGIDALGFAELTLGDAEIGIREFRNRTTLPEEASHVFIAMLEGTPLKERLFKILDTDDFYKEILGTDLEAYEKVHNGNKEALLNEAAAKALADKFILKHKSYENNKGLSFLLQKVWDYVKNLISRISKTNMQRELDILTNTIPESIISRNISDIGGEKQNIKPLGKFYELNTSINKEQKLLKKTLESLRKRELYYERRLSNNPNQEVLQKSLAKYQKLIKDTLKNYEEATYVTGISNYLVSLSEDANVFLDSISVIESKFANIESAKDVQFLATQLKNMKYSVDTNKSTLESIIDILGRESRKSLQQQKNYNELLQLAEQNLKTLDIVEKNYYDLGGKLVGEFLKPLLGNRNSADLLDDINRNRPEAKKLKPLQLEEALKSAEGDISFLVRWLDSMAETPDDVLKLIDVAVKDQKLKALLQNTEDKKTLMTLEKELTKAGLKSSQIAEVDPTTGKPTGYFVTESNWGAWYNKRAEFFKQLDADIAQETDYTGYKDMISQGAEDSVTRPYRLRINSFYNQHTLSDYRRPNETMSEVDRELAHKANILTREEYYKWFHFNVRFDRAHNKYVILRDTNPQYMAIQSNPALKRYYDAVLDMKYKLDRYLPEQMQHGRRLPQIHKDLLERLKTASHERDSKSFVNVFKQIKEGFQILEDDDEHGVSYELSNDEAHPVKFLPIYYVQKLQNPTELSLDISSTMALYSLMANDYHEMSKVIDVLEISKDIVDSRTIYKVDPSGRPIMENINVLGTKLQRRLRKPKGASLVADRLNDYFNMVLYGEWKAKEPIKGTKLDRGKMLDTFNSYVSLTALGFNLFAGVANINMGKTMERLDAIAQTYFTEKDILYADAMYTKDLANIVGSVGSPDGKNYMTNSYSKINLWAEMHDTLQDRKQETKELHAGRKNFFARMFNLSSIFFINRAGEHWLQIRTSVALANSYRYDTTKGKFVWRKEFYDSVTKLEREQKAEIHKLKSPTAANIKKIKDIYKPGIAKEKEKLDAKWKDMTNYYEAFEKQDNKLVIKNGINDNFEDRKAFINRQNSLNNSFHGIYNDVDKSAAQQYSMFRLVNAFRKWMVPFFNRRFSKTQYNFQLDDYTQGYYNTVGMFIGTLLREWKNAEYSLRKHWNTLSDLEKANFKKAIAETAHLIGWLVLALVLEGLVSGGSDDDEWALQMMAYQANRMVTEIGSMYPTPLMLRELGRMIQRPVPGSSYIENIFDMTRFWQWGDVLESGRFKDKTRLEKALIKGTPVLSQAYDLGYIEEKMVFFNR